MTRWNGQSEGSVFQVPGPTAPASRENSLGIQVVHSFSRHTESKTRRGNPETCVCFPRMLKSDFIAKLANKGWWSILELEIILKYNSKKWWKKPSKQWNWGKGLPGRATAFAGWPLPGGLTEWKAGLLLLYPVTCWHSTSTKPNQKQKTWVMQGAWSGVLNTLEGQAETPGTSSVNVLTPDLLRKLSVMQGVEMEVLCHWGRLYGTGRGDIRKSWASN